MNSEQLKRKTEVLQELKKFNPHRDRLLHMMVNPYSRPCMSIMFSTEQDYLYGILVRASKTRWLVFKYIQVVEQLKHYIQHGVLIDKSYPNEQKRILKKEDKAMDKNDVTNLIAVIEAYDPEEKSEAETDVPEPDSINGRNLENKLLMGKNGRVEHPRSSTPTPVINDPCDVVSGGNTETFPPQVSSLRDRRWYILHLLRPLEGTQTITIHDNNTALQIERRNNDINHIYFLSMGQSRRISSLCASDLLCEYVMSGSFAPKVLAAYEEKFGAYLMDISDLSNAILRRTSPIEPNNTVLEFPSTRISDEPMLAENSGAEALPLLGSSEGHALIEALKLRPPTQQLLDKLNDVSEPGEDALVSLLQASLEPTLRTVVAKIVCDRAQQTILNQTIQNQDNTIRGQATEIANLKAEAQLWRNAYEEQEKNTQSRINALIIGTESTAQLIKALQKELQEQRDSNEAVKKSEDVWHKLYLEQEQKTVQAQTQANEEQGISARLREQRDADVREIALLRDEIQDRLHGHMELRRDRDQWRESCSEQQNDNKRLKEEVQELRAFKTQILAALNLNISHGTVTEASK